MKNFTVRMSDGREYLLRGERMKDILDLIGMARLTNSGFLDVRIQDTYKYVTINVEQIVSIEEEDDI